MTKNRFLILPMVLAALIFSGIAPKNPVKADEFRVSRRVEWQPSGDLIAVGGNYDVGLYNSKMDEVSHIRLGALNEILDTIAWNPTGTQLAVLSAFDGENAWRLQIWEVEPLAQILDYTGTDTLINISQMSWNPTGDLIALGFYNKLEVLNATDATLVFEIPDLTFEITGLAWRPDATTDQLIVANYTNMKLLDGRTGVPITIFSEEGDFADVVWSPDGDYIAVVTDVKRDIQIWDVETREVVSTLEAHSNNITDLVWGEGGLASSSYEGIYLWDLAMGEPKDSLEIAGGVTSISWNPDNDAIVYGNLEGLPVIVPIPFPN